MAQLRNTTISDTGSLNLPVGTTAQRPASPSAGMIRYNTTIADTEYYDGAAWRPISDSFPLATGGTVVDTDIGGVPYRIHLFTATGNSTFTVTKGGEVEYLIVAGGGGGGSRRGGGGGAGGLLTGTTTVTPQSYTVTVGTGGLGLVTNTTNGIIQQRSNGGNSSAFGLTAIGGGAGGHYTVANANSGGSGAGGSGSSLTSGASGTPGQGNSGGNGVSNEQIGAGGGGAGAPGKNGIAGGTAGKPGDGGIGLVSSITGTSLFYAGGGAGGRGDGTSFTDNRQRGTGGLGGGGFGGNNSTFPGPGTPNTGGGGGAHGGSHGVVDQSRYGISEGAAGENGGSGIVIVRYRRNATTATQPDETRPSFQPYFYARDVRPIIARDGLVLELDAANPLSYPGTGTTWTDLSDNGNDGTLVNGVGFDSNNQGSMVFDGVNTRINTNQHVTSFLIGECSVSFWVFFDSTQTTRNCILYAIGNSTSLGTGGGSDGSSSNDNINLQTRFTNELIIHLPRNGGTNNVLQVPGLIFNNWSFLTVQWKENANEVQGYVNGKIKASTTNASFDFFKFTDSSNSITTIGNNGGDQAFNGKIAKVLIYNRTLSLQEIQQNFNATRGRYGI